MFLLVPAYLGCPGSKAVKRLLLLFPGEPVTKVWQTSLDFTEARDMDNARFESNAHTIAFISLMLPT